MCASQMVAIKALVGNFTKIIIANSSMSFGYPADALKLICAFGHPVSSTASG